MKPSPYYNPSTKVSLVTAHLAMSKMSRHLSGHRSGPQGWQTCPCSGPPCRAPLAPMGYEWIFQNGQVPSDGFFLRKHPDIPSQTQFKVG